MINSDLTASPPLETLKHQVRLTILCHRIGPYHFARIRAAAQKFPTTVIEAFKSDDTYAWDVVEGAEGFTRVTLFGKSTATPSALLQGIRQGLDNCRPGAVAVPGWADVVAFGALQWCGAHAVPAIMMSETTQWDESRRGWKELVKRRLVGMCAAGLVGGRPHGEYLALLGMPQRNIFQGYDAVDNDHFVRGAAAARKQAQEIRSRLELPENFFLASARFVEKKNLLGLLEAYARYRTLAEKAGKLKSESSDLRSPTSTPWSLVLLGDGPLRSSILDLRSSLGLDAWVHLPGFKQYGELPAYYALAKAFIHASTTEQWGLVVNEAMASGLPVLVSNHCGCAQDLVHEGVNGFVFDPKDIGQLASLMQKVSAPEFPLAQGGAESQRIVSNWGPERFGCGLEEAVKVALATPPPALGLLDRFLLRLLTRI